MNRRKEPTKVAFLPILLGIVLAFHVCSVADAQVQYDQTGLEPTQVVDGIPIYDITQTESSNGYLMIGCQEVIVNFDADLWGGGVIDVGYSGCTGIGSAGPTLNFGLNAGAYRIQAGCCSRVNLHGGSVLDSVNVYPGAVVKIDGDGFDVYNLDASNFEAGHYDSGAVLHSTGGGRILIFAYAGNTFLFSGPVYIAEGASVLLGTPVPEDPGIDQVNIDVKPGSDRAIINLRSKGVVPVAVLSNPETGFDATLILPETVRFAGASVAVSGNGKYMAHTQDVNGDGIADVVFHFRTQDLQLQGDGAEVVVTLTGQVGSTVSVQSLQSAKLTDRGTPISGTDNVYVLGPKTK